MSASRASTWAAALALSLLTLAACSDERSAPGVDGSAPDSAALDVGLVCGSGTTDCAGQCVDTDTDTSNCGACAKACSPGQVCSVGKCGTTCGGGTTKCSDVCVDTATDEKNCGACGAACKKEQFCVAGKCVVAPCAAGQTRCKGICVDLKISPSHCGACDAACNKGEVCASGKCTFWCPAPLKQCAKACVDQATDEKHCGACDAACKAGEYCVSGKCTFSCPSPLSKCGGSCVNLQADNSHCGLCNAACVAGQLCTQGKCVTYCPPLYTDCSGVCANTQADAKHCGACGNACKVGEICSAGQCKLWCPAPLTECSGACVNSQTDPQHCGKCGGACKAGEFCSGGQCKAWCAAPRAVCGGACVDLTSDPKHCGKCGVACAKDKKCDAGGCVSKSFASCAAILAANSAAKSGVYSIKPAGVTTPFSVYCEMTSASGGWTLIATTADDGAKTWTYANRAYLWDTRTIGTVANKHKDYKSAAYFTVPFKDVMFRDKKGFWAVHVGVNPKGISTTKAWMPQTLACKTTPGRVFKMTTGNLKAKVNTSGYMQNTDVYFSITDYDACKCANQDDANGPSWAYNNNSACWPDDPACFGWGPGPLVKNDEQGQATLGPKKCVHTESNTGDWIQWYVR